MTLITAHAGCDGTKPGSIDNLRTALAKQAHSIELDLRWFGGNVLLSHDPIEVSRLQSYTTLEEALELLAGSTLRFNCDLKEANAFLPALACFAARGLVDRLDITGSYPLQQHGAEGAYRVFLNLEHIPGVPAEGKISDDVLHKAAEWFMRAHEQYPVLVGLNVDYSVLRTEQFAFLRSKRIPVMCWTVDEHSALETLLREDIYAITTNEVAFAVAAQKELYSKNQ